MSTKVNSQSYIQAHPYRAMYLFAASFLAVAATSVIVISYIFGYNVHDIYHFIEERHISTVGWVAIGAGVVTLPFDVALLIHAVSKKNEFDMRQRELEENRKWHSSPLLFS